MNNGSHVVEGTYFNIVTRYVQALHSLHHRLAKHFPMLKKKYLDDDNTREFRLN
jgi:hypothetical protein